MMESVGAVNQSVQLPLRLGFYHIHSSLPVRVHSEDGTRFVRPLSRRLGPWAPERGGEHPEKTTHTRSVTRSVVAQSTQTTGFSLRVCRSSKV